MKKQEIHSQAADIIALKKLLEEQSATLSLLRKELDIEASLDRVRTIAMGMRSPNDLPDICSVIFSELSRLGFHELRNSMVNIHDDENCATINYDYSKNAGKTITKFSYNVHPLIDKMVRGTRGVNNAFLEFCLDGEELDEWRAFRQKNGEQDDPLLENATGLYYYFYSIGTGTVGISAYNAISKDKLEVLKKFRNVFEFAYLRYLDVAQAEAQAREAQIEAALERVRSSSLAMYKSADISDVVKVLFLNLTMLGIENMDSLNINIFHEGSKDFDLWIATPGQDYTRNFHLPYFDHPIANDFFEAVEAGKTLHKKTYGFEEKNEYFKFTFENSDNRYLPEERKALILTTPAYSVSAAIAQHSSLFVHNYSGKIFSKEDDEIFIRFAHVFDQAYNRFLDLHKAELLVKEAIKQASLDRIRGQVASMRSTADLQRITQLIWEELIKLNIAFRRCGIFIMDERHSIILAYLSTPTNQSLGVLNLPFVSDDLTQRIVDGWRNKEVVRHYWTGQDFINWMQVLVDKGQIKSIESFLDGVTTPGALYLHFVPFEQGMLYVGSGDPFSNDELQAVQAMADAFSVAYGRYEDFSNLEKAKQSVEDALLELKSAQSLLVQSEKMASLGELTAGIAHEIQNPLNFINNFSEVNSELLEELKHEYAKKYTERDEAAVADLLLNLSENEIKINHHGKRADAIVKGMLQHSRNSSAAKEPYDINKLADEYLRLSYHGLKAKSKSFNVKIETDFDPSIGLINIIPQDIGRVLLNLYNNAFYACAERNRSAAAMPAAQSIETGEADNNEPVNKREPTVWVKTSKLPAFPNLSGQGRGGKVLISVRDNGSGIPQNIIDKIFQPFFTTKPTGQGTGLGLSLSYDIIKAHGGELRVETKEGEGAQFIVELPIAY